MTEKFDYNEFIKEGGRVAFNSRINAHCNPYQPLSNENFLWWAGWCDARKNNSICIMGAEAATAGIGITENPFKDDESKSFLWMHGYFSVDKENK